MELFEDPEFLNAQKSIKELARARSIKEASKIIVKASPTKFFLIFLIFILPLSLFQLLYEANTRRVVTLSIWDLYDQKLFLQKLANDSIHGCVYLVLFSTFYLLSTFGMTFAIACIHASKPLSYISVISAIPGILKRLAITFLHALPLIFMVYTAYLVVFSLICTLSVTMIPMVHKTNYVLLPLLIAMVLLCIAYICILDARAHTTALWNSANLVTVLEPNTYGSTAIKKSKVLLQENKINVDILGLLQFLNDFFVGIAYSVMVYDMNLIVKVSIISLCVIGVAAGNFLVLTAQNLMYYACTRYDNQANGKIVSDDIEMQNGNQVIARDNRVEGDN